eukprot:Gb_35657 [translate_table: standard]
MERIVSILLFMLTMMVAAATSGAVADDPQTYIVHMDPTKVQIPNSINPKSWYASLIREAILNAGKEADEPHAESNILYAYETLITGFAAKLSRKQAAALENMEGFLGAFPDTLLTLHTTYSPKFLSLKPGHGLWGKSGYGTDVIVGLLDTGVWPEHPSFGDKSTTPPPSRWKGTCEMGTAFNASHCNKKLIGGRSFYKAYEAAVGPINETAEYKSARDSAGHGSHTASTAAGNVVDGSSMLGYAKGSASGMASGARVAAYKVCWSVGCISSDILAGMDRAVADGVDVLSLSLGGSSSPFYADSIAVAAFRAVDKGVFVTCSAGNAGPSASSLSNEAPWLMTVAASSMDRSFPASVKLANGKVYRGASLYAGKRLGKKPLPVVYAEKAGGQGADFCTDGSLDTKLVTGKIVLCERGLSGRTKKGEEVLKAGGVGMILVNTKDDGEELIADAHILPATLVGAKAGNAIKNYVKSNKSPAATISFQGTVFGNTAPVVASFSSRGPNSISPDILKPDVTAPGVNILAAWPEGLGPSGLASDKRKVEFNIVSGTSMSCPHVSGLAALLKAVHPDWSPAAIKSALMTTAYLGDQAGNPIKDGSTNAPATPFDFGSGHVNPEKAVDPGLVYDILIQDYVHYFCSLNYSSFQIRLLTKRFDSCPDKVLQPGDLNYPSFSVVLRSSDNASATFTRTVTNVGPPVRCTYSVKVSQPKGVEVIVEPKVLEFKKKGQRKSFTATFIAGMASSSPTYGSITWASDLHTVRSPVAVTWDI